METWKPSIPTFSSSELWKPKGLVDTGDFGTYQGDEVPGLTFPWLTLDCPCRDISYEIVGSDTAIGSAVYQLVGNYTGEVTWRCDRGSISPKGVYNSASGCGMATIMAKADGGCWAYKRVRAALGVWKTIEYIANISYAPATVYLTEGFTRKVIGIGTGPCGSWVAGPQCAGSPYYPSNSSYKGPADPFNVGWGIIDQIGTCYDGHPTWGELCWPYGPSSYTGTYIYGTIGSIEEWWCTDTVRGY